MWAAIRTATLCENDVPRIISAHSRWKDRKTPMNLIKYSQGLMEAGLPEDQDGSKLSQGVAIRGIPQAETTDVRIHNNVAQFII